MLSISFPQGPTSLSYVFFIASDFPTLVAVDDFTFPAHGVLILGFNQQLFQCPVPIEMCLDAIFSTSLLDALPQSLDIWDDYVACVISFPGGPLLGL